MESLVRLESLPRYDRDGVSDESCFVFFCCCFVVVAEVRRLDEIQRPTNQRRGSIAFNPSQPMRMAHLCVCASSAKWSGRFFVAPSRDFFCALSSSSSRSFFVSLLLPPTFYPLFFVPPRSPVFPSVRRDIFTRFSLSLSLFHRVCEEESATSTTTMDGTSTTVCFFRLFSFS